MNFKEFKLLDSLNAYADYKSVDYAKMTGEIPEILHDYINSKCMCGSDRMTNGVSLTCCNPRCYIKLGHRLSEFFSYFGAKNLGPATCIKITKLGVQGGIFSLPSQLEVFTTFEKFEYLLGEKYYDLLLGLETVHKNTLTLGQMVQSVGIPGFDTNCSELFKDISSTTQLKEKLNEEGVVQFLHNKGIDDLKKCLNLVLYLSDVFILERTFRGEKIEKIIRNVKICITGPVYPDGVYMKREDFIRHVNSISKIGNVQLFNISESGPSTSAYVIADSPSTNSKYIKAKQRESFNPGVKVIYSATEFVNLIKEEVRKCKELNQT